MGSAFPCDGLGSSDTVLMSTYDTSDDPLVVHMRHSDCRMDWPHRMSECRRFQIETGSVSAVASGPSETER